MDRMEPTSDEAKMEFQKAVMSRKDEKHKENLGTIQKDIEEAAGKSGLEHKKSDRDKAVKETPENVRIREEAAARCTKVITRRVLKKQARKTRSDHLVKCSLMPGRIIIIKEPLSELYVNGNFMEDREELQK